MKLEPRLLLLTQAIANSTFSVLWCLSVPGKDLLHLYFVITSRRHSDTGKCSITPRMKMARRALSFLSVFSSKAYIIPSKKEAPSQNAREIKIYLDRKFPGRWIGRAGLNPWTLRSPDMTPLILIFGRTSTLLIPPYCTVAVGDVDTSGDGKMCNLVYRDTIRYTGATSHPDPIWKRPAIMANNPTVAPKMYKDWDCAAVKGQWAEKHKCGGH
ncbi:hypothetical protein ANN_16781 [Periplaneta americana]|uniref:Uncharacterized protein n=1 Tax=Periplaneta americana TaxID=6978 RepID=A0ABQ8ST82_PERAM|nr:hypothetical protein ANN_16781 [Periplaneta americana]